jgi:hypothetical protein
MLIQWFIALKDYFSSFLVFDYFCVAIVQPIYDPVYPCVFVLFMIVIISNRLFTKRSFYAFSFGLHLEQFMKCQFAIYGSIILFHISSPNALADRCAGGFSARPCPARC